MIKSFKMLIVPAILFVFIASGLVSATSINLPSMDHISEEEISFGNKQVVQSYSSTSETKFNDIEGGLFVGVLEKLAKNIRKEVSLFAKNGINDLSANLNNVADSTKMDKIIIASNDSQVDKVFASIKTELQDLAGEERVESKIDVNYFLDIQDDPAYYFINILAERDIISQQSDYFYPHNHVRLHEVCKMILNAYSDKTGVTFSTKEYIEVESNYPKHYQIAYSLGLLDEVRGYDIFDKPMTHYDIHKILKNFNIQYSDIIDSSYLATKNLFVSRSSFAKSLVMIFDLDNKKGEYVIADSYGHQYGKDIEILFQKGVLDYDKKMNEKLTRLDFAQILAKAIFVYQDQILADLPIQAVEHKFVDISDIPEDNVLFNYLSQYGVLDYLVESKRGKKYLSPNEYVTRHEVYYILESISDSNFFYDVIQADQEKITIAEFSQIVTEVFNFTIPEQKKSSFLGYQF